MPEPKFHVGQTVYRRDINRKGFQEVEVKQVGRKLVHVDVGYGRWEVFRIDSGRKNDDYGHAWIQTPEEYWEQEDRIITIERLKDRGLEIRRGFEKDFRRDLIQMIVELIDEDRD